LIDKTNREGLIENESYIGLRHLVLGVVEIFEGELIEDRQALRPKKEKTPELELEKSLDSIFATLNAAKDNVQKKGETASASVIDELMPILQKGIDELRQTFGDQSDYYQGERKTLLALAGTGLAAERFTHEFSRLVNGANTALERLERRIASDIERDPKTKRDVDTIRGALEALKNDIRLLGPMFYIKRVAREKELDVWQMVENTRALQEVALHRSGIVFEIVGGTFSITMREGSCMQVLNNLVDNAIFWVSRKSEADRRKIRVVIDPDEQSVYVSDSGPGVIARHREKIFEPFFSLKGEEGRGLGLYIAQEILEEKAWSIAVVDADAHPSLLNGANFKILFRGTNA
jgi:signal transduction histidine kinase